jgi:hypothetical protein
MRASHRRLTVVVALLLLTGCGARTDVLDPWLWQDGGTPLPDSVVEAGPDADEDAPPDPANVGRCVFGAGKEILCEPGQTCMTNYLVGPSPFICQRTLDPSVPCGLISCGDACWCENASTSTCRCQE